jgi:Transcription initiation factor IID, 18kD subunit
MYAAFSASDDVWIWGLGPAFARDCGPGGGVAPAVATRSRQHICTKEVLTERQMGNPAGGLTAWCGVLMTHIYPQDIVVDYVTTMMHKAMDESAKRGKLATEDLVYLVRKVQTPSKLLAPATCICTVVQVWRKWISDQEFPRVGAWTAHMSLCCAGPTEVWPREGAAVHERGDQACETCVRGGR